MFAVIEMADVELLGVHLFNEEAKARAAYDRACQENRRPFDDPLFNPALRRKRRSLSLATTPTRFN